MKYMNAIINYIEKTNHGLTLLQLMKFWRV
nr:MAG TPA: hypothetical protein [Caudoviricetes sp.]